jgi:histidinol-phosphate aminotransferase
MFMNRRDWTEALPKSNELDLSNNICYDRFINFYEDQNIMAYPDDSEAYSLLSTYYNINAQHIAIGYGSCELILRILQLYKEWTLHIVTPTWQLADLYAKHIGMTQQKDADILYIANPNGLTGKALSAMEILKLLPKYQLVIVDEAYGDFSGSSVLDYTTVKDNLIVVKTLSKTIAAPGLRFGYCFSAANIIKRIQDCRPGYVTTGLTANALKKLLPQVNLHIARMIDTRDYIESKYEVEPSQGNYVLFKTDPHFAVKMKEINGLYRMSLTDLITFKELENEYR